MTAARHRHPARTGAPQGGACAAALARAAWRLVRAAVPALLLVGLWELAVQLWRIPPYLLPSPGRIGQELYLRHGLLAAHAAVTAGEVLAGFAVGSAAGFALALALDGWPALRRALVPWLVGSQAVPVFAVAPLLVLWFGYGLASKVAMASVITFFPVTVAALEGLRPDPDALRLMVALGASRGQILRHLKLPGAMPSVFAGLKVAASVSTIAAVIGEWVGARAGLGYLMTQANAQLRVSLVFASLVWLTGMGLALYGLVELAQRLWERRR